MTETGMRVVPQDERPVDVRRPATGSGATWPIFEVFRQERPGQPMQHAGNLTAPDADMAELYAREFYGRRNESIRLWVAPRAAIREIVDADLLHPPAVDRSYRSVQGYTVRDKLDAARAHGEDNIPGAPGRKARPARPASAMEIPSDV
jgi:ring-1,2-phenylacetyl-CoA epoxidase subunit PaaB